MAVGLDPFQNIVNVNWGNTLFLGVYARVGSVNNAVVSDATINVSFGPRLITDGHEQLGLNAPHAIDSSDLAESSVLITRVFDGPDSNNVQAVYLANLEGQNEFDFQVQIVLNNGGSHVDLQVFLTDSSNLRGLLVDMPGESSGNPIPTVDAVSPEINLGTVTRTYRVNVAAKTIVQI